MPNRYSSIGKDDIDSNKVNIHGNPVECWDDQTTRVKVRGISNMIVQDQIEGTPIEWKIDTGAKIAFITNETFDLIADRPNLESQNSN